MVVFASLISCALLKGKALHILHDVELDILYLSSGSYSSTQYDQLKRAVMFAPLHECGYTKEDIWDYLLNKKMWLN